jgi:integrin alpha FG-GAP repeat containing protein 1
VSVPISALLRGNTKLHILDTSFSPAQPILPRTGDANLDGFPDLLLITDGRVRLLLSTPCARGVPGCAAEGVRHGWRQMVKGVEPLTGITDARIAVFVDLDEDGTLDMMVQRTGEQGAGRVLFVQNNFYYDAFFMKAIRTQGFSLYILLSVLSDLLASRMGAVLNGACSSGWCQPENDSLPRYPVRFFSYHLLPRHK